MGIVIRQSIKSATVAYVGIAIGTVNMLYLSARYLPPAYIGLTRNLLEAALLFTSVTQLGTVQITDRYFSHFKDDQRGHRGFLGLVLLYPLLGFGLFCAAFFLFKDYLLGLYLDRAPLLTHYANYLLPLALFVMYQNVLEAYCRVHLRIVVPTLVREVYLKLANGLIITLFALCWIGVDGLVQLMVASYALAVGWLLLYVRLLGRLYLNLALPADSRPLLREMASYGLYIIMGGIGVQLATKIDTLMTSAMLSLAATGVYTIAFFMAQVIEMPKRAISQISIPLIAQAWKENNLPKIAQLYRQTALHQLLAGAFVFLCIWCNIDGIFALMSNADTYRPGKYVVLWLGLAKLVDMGTGIDSEIILYSRYYRFAMVTVALLAGCTIGFNLVLIPRFGITGAAMATLAALVIFAMTKQSYLWLRFRLHPYSRQHATVIGLALVAYALTRLVPVPAVGLWPNLLGIVVRGLLVLATLGGGALALRVSPEVNALAAAVWQWVGRRLGRQ